jgi:hypothetical protein
LPVSSINAHGNTCNGSFFESRDFVYDRLDECGGHIVNTVVAQVFEHMERDALSGTGKPAYHNESGFF